MTRNLVKLLALLVLGSTVQPACAPPTRPTAAAPGARASSPEVVHVAPPTGEREIDRSSILAALERIQPGGTVQFAPGTYLVGEIIRVEVPRITILGHPDGTTLRGCDPAEFVEAEVAMVACNGFELTGGHQAVRDLTFEYTWDALWVGCCLNPTAPGEGGQPSHVGGQLIEGNTFRSSMNGIRVIGDSPEPAVIRNNDFINVWHAAVVNGRTAHILDNRVSAPEPARIPITGLPGLAIGVTAFDTRLEQAFTCTHNIIAGNRVEGHPEGIAILAFRSGGSCRENVIRRNRIVPSRVRFGSPSWGVIGLRDEADSSIAGVPLALAELVTEMSEYFGLPEELGEEALIEDNLIEGNQILGAEGLGIEVLRASRNRIVHNSITGVVRRDPFPGNTLGFAPEWGGANGTGIWVSPGSEENEIVGNTFTDIAAHAVVLEGDRNRVETRSAADSVRDLGSGNRVSGPAGASFSGATRSVNGDAQAVESAIRGYLDAYTAMDPGRLRAWTTYDFLLIENGYTAGLDRVVEGMDPTGSLPFTHYALRDLEIEVDGDIAVYRLVVEWYRGENRADGGIGTGHLRRLDGGWRLARDHMTLLPGRHALSAAALVEYAAEYRGLDSAGTDDRLRLELDGDQLFMTRPDGRRCSAGSGGWR